MSRRAFFKVRPARRQDSGFVAWGALEPLKADDAVREQADPVYFQFAGTESEAVEKLKREMEALRGELEWRQQEAKS